MKRNLPLAITGLGAACLILLSSLMSSGGASSDDPPATIAGYYAQHGRADLVSDYVSVLATVLLLAVFCVRAARAHASLGAMLIAAAGAAAFFELAATGIEMALAASVHQQAPATTTAALFQVASRFFFVSTLAIGAAVGAASLAEDRTWLRWLGLATSALLVVAGLSVAYPHGLLGIMLLPAWGLLLAWLAAGSAAAWRGDHLAADQDPVELASAGPRSR